MLRTLVLLRMRCGCFDTEEEVGGGTEDNVWTLEKQESKKHVKILNVLGGFFSFFFYCTQKNTFYVFERRQRWK